MTILQSFKTSEKYLSSDRASHPRRLESATIRVITFRKIRLAGHVTNMGQLRK
jgi:hypothetical protein